MGIHPQAGQPAPRESLVNVPRLVSAYYTRQPNPEDPAEQVRFGTSGHRGSSLASTFNEAHILAICQAIAEHRASKGIDGPLFLGPDTHALSEPALLTAVEVFAAQGVVLRISKGLSPVPTPAVSHAILAYNKGRTEGLADGVIITPSHNPPEDGGIKYNPPSGGPAGGGDTRWIQDRANALLLEGVGAIRRMTFEQGIRADTTDMFDFLGPYVDDLDAVIDMAAIKAAGLKLGADPMGGAGAGYWAPIAARWGLDIEVVNPHLEPDFRFMTLDKDGRIRMDCSSPWAMAGLIDLGEHFDVAFGNDPDFDRHGIVTRSGGLMNPNHYLAVAIEYLFGHRTQWPKAAKIGKTLVSSAMIDRVAASLGRELAEVPVGFKHFVDGLQTGTFGFGGEESAGASFLRKDGTVWTTDKDGMLLCLLAAEITAVTGKDPSEHYKALEERFGSPVYQRLDAPATVDQKAALKALSPEMVAADTLAGDPIVAKLTHAPGNGEAIGGLKVATEHGWFAARPSGTEAIYKIYAESFRGEAHLTDIQSEAQAIVAEALAR